jgi:hypothetical protein
VEKPVGKPISDWATKPSGLRSSSCTQCVDGGDFAGPLGPELRVQHLQRDTAAVLEVLCEVNRGHSAAAHLMFDHVAIGKCGAKAFLELGPFSMSAARQRRARNGSAGYVRIRLGAGVG